MGQGVPLFSFGKIDAPPWNERMGTSTRYSSFWPGNDTDTECESIPSSAACKMT